MEFISSFVLLIGLGQVYMMPFENSHAASWTQPSKYWGDKGLDMLGSWKPLQYRSNDGSWPKRQISENTKDDPVAHSVAAKQSEFQYLLQQLYQAEASVKMESGEVTRTQEVAEEAERNLEEAANKVRIVSAELQAAQEAAASAAMKAQTAHIQLSAHDQLMFTARQQVDDISAKLDSVQAILAAAQQEFTLANSTQHLQQQGNFVQPPNFNEDPPHPPEPPSTYIRPYLSKRYASEPYNLQFPGNPIFDKHQNYPYH